MILTGTYVVSIFGGVAHLGEIWRHSSSIRFLNFKNVVRKFCGFKVEKLRTFEGFIKVKWKAKNFLVFYEGQIIFSINCSLHLGCC